MSKVVASGLIAASTAAAAYLLTVHRHISPVKQSDVHVTNSNPTSFLESSSCRTQVNPHGHVSLNDTRSLRITLPPSKHNATDEQILASFVKGFFGGWAFTPERILFQALRQKFGSFSKISQTGVHRVWSAGEISDTDLPPLHAVYFGAFQVLDKRIRDQASGNENDSGNGNGNEVSPPAEESYVDFGFSSDKGSFAGVHRFAVRRVTKDDSQSSTGPEVQINFSCHTCNPTENKPIKPDLLFALHKFYAMLLFREGVANVLRP